MMRGIECEIEMAFARQRTTRDRFRVGCLRIAVAILVTLAFLLLLHFQGNAGDGGPDDGLVIFWDLSQRTRHLIVMKSDTETLWTEWELYVLHVEDGVWRRWEDPFFEEEIPVETLERLREIEEGVFGCEKR